MTDSYLRGYYQGYIQKQAEYAEKWNGASTSAERNDSDNDANILTGKWRPTASQKAKIKQQAKPVIEEPVIDQAKATKDVAAARLKKK